MKKFSQKDFEVCKFLPIDHTSKIKKFREIHLNSIKQELNRLSKKRTKAFIIDLGSRGYLLAIRNNASFLCSIEPCENGYRIIIPRGIQIAYIDNNFISLKELAIKAFKAIKE